MDPVTRQGDWTTVVLAGISAGWGLVLIVLAFVLPFVTPATAWPSPPITLVRYNGSGVLLFVVLPLLVSLVVGLLLWPRGNRRSRVAAAWSPARAPSRLGSG